MNGEPPPEAPRIWERPIAGGSIRLGLVDGWLSEDALIVGMHLPPSGATVPLGGVLAVVDVTTKVCRDDVCTYERSRTELQAPRPLRIVAVNGRVVNDPPLAQEDPEGLGWLVEAQVDRQP